MRCHRIKVWWIDRWASNGPQPRYIEFSGTDQEILALIDRHEVDVQPIVSIQIDHPNPTALEYSVWEANLRADGGRAVVMTNSGNWFVGVIPGSETGSGEVEIRDARGVSSFEPADVIVDRELAFAGLRAWLTGRDGTIDGLTWDLYRNRGRG